MAALPAFLLLLGSALACDPDLSSVLLHKCDTLPFRTLTSKFECVASTPINYDCGQLAFLGGTTERILVTSPKAAQYIRQGLMSDENSQMCLIQWKGICDGVDRIDDLCVKVEESPKTWSAASSDCDSRSYNLFTPHTDADLQKFWSYVRDYSSEDFWLGAATAGNVWLFSDDNTVDFFRLFPDTFSNQSLLSCNGTGGGGGGGGDDTWTGDWWTPLVLPSTIYKRQADGWPQDPSCDSSSNGDLWPHRWSNCSGNSNNPGSCGEGMGADGALALIFHSKSQSHAYLGYEAVRMASDRFPYVCVKPSSPYVALPSQPVTTVAPPIATTSFPDVWPNS